MEFIAVGKIINTHGIRGEVKIYPYTDEINRFSDFKTLYLGEQKIKVQVESVKYFKGIVIMKFKDYSDINEVLLFKDEIIYIDYKDRINLPKNHYFIFDLLECEVVDLSGKTLGYVSDVLEYASNDVYTVKDYENNKEYFIPAVKEFIKEVNIEDKKIVIDPIEGMIE